MRTRESCYFYVGRRCCHSAEGSLDNCPCLHYKPEIKEMIFMPMEKRNVVKTGTTCCDECSKPSDVVIINGRALCDEHIQLAKTATPKEPALKAYGDVLSFQHKF